MSHNACTHPDGHFPDNQGFCHECGFPAAYANCTEFYISWNYIDEDFQHKRYIKKEPFDDYQKAKRYIATVAKTRDPKILVAI